MCHCAVTEQEGHSTTDNISRWFAVIDLLCNLSMGQIQVEVPNVRSRDQHSNIS